MKLLKTGFVTNGNWRQAPGFDMLHHNYGSWYYELCLPNTILHVQGQQVRIHCHHDLYKSPVRKIDRKTKTNQNKRIPWEHFTYKELRTTMYSNLKVLDPFI